MEKIIDQALALIESGKSSREILDMLPEYKKELQEIFQLLDLLNVQKEKIVPSQKFLTKIIANLPAAGSVTEKEIVRYLLRGEQKPGDYAWQNGRPSKKIIKSKINDLMTINWKVWTPLGIIAVVALAIIGSYQLRTETETPQTPIAAPTQELPATVTKPATGNIDDTVNAILASVSDDQTFFADVEKDAELITADSQAISNFGQSFNENEF